ncbi:hypothetical protein QAD02_004287 [Eretmocerus hayati]|uniref:Uncharacterized protein n=1 Tax=Eretmocerus hayati TaxID=131215 RepID=A0ACC2NPH1_9HYME|nr:hypothetical protein QAD02_004287 [Eretmocerus hayati]
MFVNFCPCQFKSVCLSEHLVIDDFICPMRIDMFMGRGTLFGGLQVQMSEEANEVVQLKQVVHCWKKRFNKDFDNSMENTWGFALWEITTPNFNVCPPEVI